MANSTLLLDGEDGSSCSGGTGSYYLSKSHLQVVVERDDTDKPKFKEVRVVPRADRSSGYCLTFISSMTSKDTFIVQKHPEEQLLTKITSRAEDRSTEIANTIVQTVFKGLEAGAAGRDFRAGGVEGPPRLTNAFEGEYDPFNGYQARLLNEGLNDTGFCLFLDDGVRNRRTSIAVYCDDPLGGLSREQVLQKANAYASRKGRAEEAFQQADGILYRPRLPYTLYLFQNRRPGLRLPGTWVLWQSATVYLENKSPTLAVAIDRTYFATRKTTLRFAMGVLQDVYIEKDSELANAATIPLTIANNLAALPSKLIQVRLNVTNRREQLIRAQDQLIEAERALALDRGKLQAELASVPKGKEPDAGTDLPGADAETEARCKRDMERCLASGATTESACAIATGCPEP